jgi:hypothetical protein
LKIIKEYGLAVLLAFALVLIITINANLQPKPDNRELARAVFHVA